ncbi:MAG: family 1 encapsulin nanocompartment shell protein [Methanoregula sp.]|uniref:family 1 encapsulin nanocompartment shell protein n=1 Tax=Methanoregula sp. TaxID=2052170 RepID=UPI003BB157AA
MVNNYLARDDAPIDAASWKLIDDVMVKAAKSQIVGRRILPIEGPFGFGLKVIPLGDYAVDDGLIGSTAIPLTMIRTEFSLAKRDLASFERDHLVLDTNPVSDAAMEAAEKEDKIIFSGLPGIEGLLNAEGSGSLTLTKWDKVGAAADQIINAVTKLDEAGFHGPYTMALAPAQYNLLLRRYPQGDGTELDHIRSIVTEGVVKAPALKKGGVLLASGSQYTSIAIGQDMVTGYNGPIGDLLEFQIYESLALLIRAPESILVLK